MSRMRTTSPSSNSSPISGSARSARIWFGAAPPSRELAPAPPHLLNLDNTYKPENWYMYAQLADVCCADPYFQEQQRIVWNERPAWAPSFIKPLYVLGAATICNSACAPKPLHIILNSVRHDTKGGPFRFATPPEKTVELFYALGAGTKSFSYWW